MSFIKSAYSNMDYVEAIVLQHAVKKIIPTLEDVVREAADERKEKAKANLAAAKDMLIDLEEALK